MNDFCDYLLRHPLPQQNPHQRLTEAECDELFALFDDTGLPATTMSAEMADGYLTACVVGPVPVPAHEWMQAIFGQPTLPVCADPERQHRLLQLLLHRHRDIDTSTAIAPGDVTMDKILAPLRGEIAADEIISPYQLDEQGRRKGSWSGSDWAEGFRRAIVEEPLWGKLAHDPESSVLLTPVMVYQGATTLSGRKFKLSRIKIFCPCSSSATTESAIFGALALTNSSPLLCANPPRSAATTPALAAAAKNSRNAAAPEPSAHAHL